jgi:hypothetical protein
MGDPTDPENIEDERARVERLGRERPEQFSSLWKEIGFIYSVVMSQAITVRIDSPFV